MLPDDDYEKKEEMIIRAKKLFLRARGYTLRAFTLQNPQFTVLIDENELDKAFFLVNKEDLPYLYWTGTAWMAAISVDPFDVSLMVTMPVALRCIEKVVELDDGYDKGGGHELLLSYYGSLPAEMGGGEERARYHYQKALTYCEDKKVGPHLALATSVCINSQNKEEFLTLLDTAMAIDVNEPTEFRLFNIINQQKALWYYEHIDDFFI
jgi:predicted anti-sigma-YlaC factor YlaD